MRNKTMITCKSQTLVLAFGNDILSDDAAALMAIRALKNEISQEIDFEESTETGLALIEKFEGYERVMILDTFQSEEHPPGSIIEMNPGMFTPLEFPSPHYAGIQDIFRFAEWYEIKLPKEIRILAITIPGGYEFGEVLSGEVEKSVPELVDRARSIINHWLK